LIERISRAMEGWTPGLDRMSDAYLRFQRVISCGFVALGFLVMLAALAGGAIEEF